MPFSETVIIAIIGAGGVIVGTLLSIVGQIAQEWFKEGRNRAADNERMKLLKEMLEDQTWTWRTLSVLKHVIGADDETTKRLLLEIGARGSEDGEDQWGLRSRNPFKQTR